jgi:hypothetical protein
VFIPAIVLGYQGNSCSTCSYSAINVEINKLHPGMLPKFGEQNLQQFVFLFTFGGTSKGLQRDDFLNVAFTKGGMRKRDAEG